MKTFSGSLSSRLMLVFWCAMGLAAVYFMVAPVNRAFDSSFMLLRGMFALLFGGIELMAVYGLLESFTVYRTDVDGISRRAWNGTKRLEWRNLTRYSADGQRDGAIKLTDHQGRRLTVTFILLGKAATSELREIIEAHLTTQYEKQLDEVGAFQKTWYPSRSAGFAGILLLFMIGGMALFLSIQPVPDDQRIAFWIVMLMVAGMGALFLWATIYAISRTLTISSDGLTDRTVFRTRQIPFSRVTSVMSRTVHTKSGTTEFTTIKGDGQKIILQLTMTDYPLLLAFIHKNVAPTAGERGQIAAIELKSKQEKQARIFLPIIASIYFLFLGGMGSKSVRDANEHLAHYHLMDTQGRTMTGQITGRETKGSKTTRYLLDFAFDAGGTRVDSASPVPYENYSYTRIGSAASIIYVPSQPNICRLTNSIGREGAEAEVRRGYYYLIVAFVVTPVLGLTPFFKRKKTSG